METSGKWTKDENGYMEFYPPSLQRLYEIITDQYQHIYNQHLDEYDDDEEAYHKVLEAGYEMTTDYKTMADVSEFVTTYTTPGYVLDIWYETDKDTGKRIYDRGYINIRMKE